MQDLVPVEPNITNLLFWGCQASRRRAITANANSLITVLSSWGMRVVSWQEQVKKVHITMKERLWRYPGGKIEVRLTKYLYPVCQHCMIAEVRRQRHEERELDVDSNPAPVP